MQILLRKLLFILSYLPFGPGLLKKFYLFTLQKAVSLFQDHEHLEDIVLISHLPTFSYGRNQLTLLLITKNEIHPKGFLQEFRIKLSSHIFFRLTINLEYIPVLTHKEFKLDVLKGFLIRNSLRDTVKWRSLVKGKDYVFYLGKQNQFAINHTSYLNIVYYFLNPFNSAPLRTKVRNTRRSLQNFQKSFSFEIDSSWDLLTDKMIKFPALGPWFKRKFFTLTWRQLLKTKDLPGSTVSHDPLPEKYLPLKFCQQILELDYVEDIFVTPSLIQIDPEELRGKAYLDIILKQYPGHKPLKRLHQEIVNHSTKRLKIRARFMTRKLFELNLAEALAPFPLEPLLRKEVGFSLTHKPYRFNVSYEALILACIHFLSSQFMRFRSLEQKSELIGSKFIKSLNLMLRYHLINSFLEGEEFHIHTSPKEIRDFFTPQFAHLHLQDPVSEEDWVIIEAQLKYLLKKIRIKLTRYDDSLSQLRF